MKHEWRKHEKNIYLPKKIPMSIEMPTIKYFVISGKGNPNSDMFAEYIGVLYSVSYAIKMSYKWDIVPQDYYEYTVYPLEGVWDIADKSKYVPGAINKDNLAFELMIRQPSFLNEELAKEIIEKTKKKKPHVLLDSVEFKEIDEKSCVQMLHLGSYDSEPASFDLMKQYCIDNNLKRISMKHREIYLTDARKTTPDKNKTVLRFKVEKL